MGNNNNEVSYSGTVNHYESKHLKRNTQRRATTSTPTPTPKATPKSRAKPSTGRSPLRGRVTRAKENFKSITDRLAPKKK